MKCKECDPDLIMDAEEQLDFLINGKYRVLESVEAFCESCGAFPCHRLKSIEYCNDIDPEKQDDEINILDPLPDISPIPDDDINLDLTQHHHDELSH